MSSYVDRALDSRAYLPELTEKTLETINLLDEVSVKVHEVIDEYVDECKQRKTTSKRKIQEIQSMRNISESLCEKKAHLALVNYDLIDENVRQLDEEIKILEKVMTSNGNEKLVAAIGNNYTPGGSMDTRRRSTRLENDDNGDENGANAIDPNEPVYCVCRQIAHGDMIACDNEDCAIEWFHYQCVNLNPLKKPKNNWLCPSCKSASDQKKTR
jgi:hypothetical protein